MEKYQFFESIRLKDGQFDLLDFHETRLRRTQHLFYGEISKAFSLFDFLHQFPFPQKGLFKCRLQFGENLAEPEFIPYQKRKIQSIKLIRNDEINYDFKSTNRQSINELIEQKGDFDDVLIIRNGLITDTSFCNIVFRKENEWFTPEKPLLAGVRRASLLEKGMIKTAKIDLEMLQKFESFKLINAMITWEEAEEHKVEALRLRSG